MRALLGIFQDSFSKNLSSDYKIHLEKEQTRILLYQLPGTRSNITYSMKPSQNYSAVEFSALFSRLPQSSLPPLPHLSQGLYCNQMPTCLLPLRTPSLLRGQRFGVSPGLSTMTSGWELLNKHFPKYLAHSSLYSFH